MSTAQASGVDPLNFWSALVVAIEVEEGIGSGAHGADREQMGMAERWSGRLRRSRREPVEVGLTDLLNNAVEVGEEGWAGSVTITPSQYKTMKQALCWAEPAAMMKAQKVQGRVGSITSISQSIKHSSVSSSTNVSSVRTLLPHTPFQTYFGAQAS